MKVKRESFQLYSGGGWAWIAEGPGGVTNDGVRMLVMSWLVGQANDLHTL